MSYTNITEAYEDYVDHVYGGAIIGQILMDEKMSTKIVSKAQARDVELAFLAGAISALEITVESGRDPIALFEECKDRLRELNVKV